MLICAIGFASIARPNECAARPPDDPGASVLEPGANPPARVQLLCKLPLICRTAPGRHGGPRHSGTSERAGPADDLVNLVKTRRAGERVMQSITRYLETTLKLKGQPCQKHGGADG